LGSAFSLRAQHEHHEPANTDSTSIGTVDFATTCSPAVKDEFNRAVSLLHSFWLSTSRTSFERVLANDPNCAIAHWGIALTHWGNPFVGLRAEHIIALGKAAVDRGRKTGEPSARERGYIEAVALLFSSADASTQRSRVEAYEAAMAKLAAQHPEDVEAQIFWALAIAQAAPPDDKSFERQRRAGAILEPLFARMPNHPGLAHYIIHAYDVPPLAPKALAAARAYADIAPSVPHALHMPSHTFTRVGMWQESVESNQRSADTAERAGESGAVLHALDYMTYAYLQMGMDREAKAALDRAVRLDARANGFAITAIPARYALDRQQWNEAAQVPVPTATAAPYVEAMSRFARAVGAARSGRPESAAPEIARLAALRDRSLEMKDPYWAQIIDIQRRGANAWMLFAAGKKQEAIAEMRIAADAEDATEKSVVTPGPLAPAREMLGFMLLEAGNATEALAAFDKAIAKEPNRFLALYGAGQAAELARQNDRAKGYFRQLVAICKNASDERPELVYARKKAV
jgi:tetratricopeptide (TPR) repeat protein